MDRFYRGLIAGIGGGILMNIVSLISYHILHFTDRRYHDWAAVLVFGHLPQDLLQTVMSISTQLLWAGFLGVLFAYLIPKVTSRGYILKGAFWGFITGFTQYAGAILLRMPYFTEHTNGTVITQFVGGIIWGVTLALLLRRFDTIPLKNRKC